MKLLGSDQMDSKFLNNRSGLFAGVIAISLISACSPDAACVMIEEPTIIQKLNEAVRPKVEYHVKEDNYTHTLEQELSETVAIYSDCGSYYTVTFTPTSNDPDLVSIGTTTTYTISNRSIKVTSVSEE